MPKKAMNTKERITSLEQTIAKQEAALNLTKERLKTEKKKQFESNMKEVDKICSKGNITFEHIISLAATIVENGLSFNDALSALKITENTDRREDISNAK